MQERDNEIKELYLKGANLLQEQKGEEAVKVFEYVCQIDDSPFHRNNLAMAYYLLKDYEQTLLVLADNIAPKAADNPYAHALACRSLFRLERNEEARGELDSAIRDFDNGIRRLGIPPSSWKEYATAIMRAAADLEDHRLIYELYRKWQSYHVDWENHFLGGAAAFNLGRYKQAINCWRIMDKMGKFMHTMGEVALLAEKGIIPPFKMGYDFYPQALNDLLKDRDKQTEEKTMHDLEAFARTGTGRMGLLAKIFSAETTVSSRQWAYEILFAEYGQWEQELATGILQANSLPRDYKFQLAETLLGLGIFAPDEPISIMDEGEIRAIGIRECSIILEKDKDLERAIQEVKRLKAKEKYAEALDVLNQLKVEGKIYAEALLIEANIYRIQNELDKAYQNLEILEHVAPEAPQLLFNLCGFWLQKADYPKALSYLERLERVIKKEKIKDPGFLKQVQEIKTYIFK